MPCLSWLNVVLMIQQWRKRIGNNSLYGRLLNQQLLLTITINNLLIVKTSENILLTDEWVTLFGNLTSHCTCHKTNLSEKEHHTHSHNGDCMMAWGCFTALRPWQLVVIDGTINFALKPENAEWNWLCISFCP